MKNSFAFGVAMEEMAANVRSHLRVSPPICPSVVSLRPATKFPFDWFNLEPSCLGICVAALWTHFGWTHFSIPTRPISPSHHLGDHTVPYEIWIHEGNGVDRIENEWHCILWTLWTKPRFSRSTYVELHTVDCPAYITIAVISKP